MAVKNQYLNSQISILILGIILETIYEYFKLHIYELRPSYSQQSPVMMCGLDFGFDLHPMHLAKEIFKFLITAPFAVLFFLVHFEPL
jgi:hypothetical protein